MFIKLTLNSPEKDTVINLDNVISIDPQDNGTTNIYFNVITKTGYPQSKTVKESLEEINTIIKEQLK